MLLHSSVELTHPSRSSTLTRKAKILLDEIVSRGRGTPPSSFHEATNGQSGSGQEMMIPAGKAGLIIGKGGETIKQLQVYTNSQSASPVAREVFHNTLTGVF